MPLVMTGLSILMDKMIAKYGSDYGNRYMDGNMGWNMETGIWTKYGSEYGYMNMGTVNKSNPNAMGNDGFDYYNGNSNWNAPVHTTVRKDKPQDLTGSQNNVIQLTCYVFDLKTLRKHKLM